MDNILQIKKLHKKYTNFSLDHISFSVPYGTIMGLVGENGAGKTTIINLILNEIKKDSGSIYIMDKDNIVHEKTLKDKIGVVFDECHFPDLFNAVELEQFLKRIYSSWQTKKYQEYLNKFGIQKDKIIKNYSKGMKVKLSFAVALSHCPRLLILDEATSGLDPIIRDEILDILLNFVQEDKNSVLFSSHITSDLEKIADYITFIHKGKLLFTKPKCELIYNYGLIKCGDEIFKSINKKDIVRYQKQESSWQVLVSDVENARRNYKKCIIKNATIDEIMLLYVKGREKL